MIEKLKYNKLLKFSSITIVSSINTFCAEEEIVLNKNSFITINTFTTSLAGFKLKKNKEEIKTRKDLLEYFLDNFSDLVFNNVDDSEDFSNGEKLEALFNLQYHYNNNELFIININGKCKESFNNIEDDKTKSLDDVFTNSELRLILQTYKEVKIKLDFPHKLKKEFEDKLKNVNGDLEGSFNVGEIKDLMEEKGFERDKIIINDGKNEFEDDDILNIAKIYVDYKDDINNYSEPKTAEIEFIAGDGLVLDKIEKKHKIDFVKDSITEDTTIFDFIRNKFKGLVHKNCKIEYFVSRDDTWYDVDGNHTFADEYKIKITINEEISDFTKKKNIEKNKININFEVNDPSKYVFISAIDSIISLEIEKGKAYDDLINKLNEHLVKDLKTGFKIYKNTKDPGNEFTTGNLEDKTTYIVVFDETATDFVKEKEKDRLYINLKFEVTDNTKFKLKQDVTDKDNIEIQQGKNYNDLLDIIKQHLGGRNLKEGFKIYKNDKNTEFTNTGILENNTKYIVVFDNDDINFVDKKTKPQKPDPQKTQETTNTEQTNNDDNETTKKGGYSGKNGKKCC